MPAPIIRKVNNLGSRIILGAVGDPTSRDWSNRVVSGDIKNLFDGDPTTFVEIDNDFGGTVAGQGKSHITFDLGRPMVLDRIVITMKSGEPSFNFRTHQDYWVNKADIFSTATFKNHNFDIDAGSSSPPYIEDLTTNDIDTGGSPYFGNPVQNFPVRFIRIRLLDDNSLDGHFNTHTVNFKFAGLDIYEQFDTRDYDVEFNDSVLDLQSWKGPRYDGCKATSKQINKYTEKSIGEVGIGTATIDTDFIVGFPTFPVWKGDNSYGKNPVLENKTTALYITSTVIGGTEEEDQFARIKHHSYIGIEKILVINLDDDTVKVLDKQSEDFDSYHRYITTDFPTGGQCNLRILDSYVQNKLKPTYHVKMNKGWLLKSLSYNAGLAPLPGKGEDGTTDLPTAGNNSDNVRNMVTNPIALYDAVSGSVQTPQYIYGINYPLQPSNGLGLYGCTYNASTGLYCANKAPLSYLTASLDNVFNFGPHYGTENNNTGTGLITSSYSQHNNGELRFRYGVYNLVDNNDNVTFQPLYTGDNTTFISNKFTREFILQDNDSVQAVRDFNLPTIEEVEFLNPTTSFTDIIKSNTTNPSITASVFIGNCVQYLNEHATETELHLTLFEGTKDFSGINDELSISTFEVDKNLDPQYLDFLNNVGRLYNSIGPTTKYIKLKNQPQFKPSIQPVTTDRIFYDTIETSEFQAVVEERQNAFVFGPGTSHQGLTNNAGRLGPNAGGFLSFDYDNSPNNSSNFSGSFMYELSFLDKDHTLIIDLDKDEELFEGIGSSGLVVIPEHIHEMVKINLEYYLEKGGLINKTTIKKRLLGD